VVRAIGPHRKEDSHFEGQREIVAGSADGIGLASARLTVFIAISIW